VIVEHTFITTRPEPDAFAAAHDLLTLLKFQPAPDPVGAREWSRGKKHARQTDTMTQLPQRVRMDFDRGRVSVAGSVELRHKRQLEARDTMVAITVALEQLLAHGQPMAAAAADALAKQAWIARMDWRRRMTWLAVLLTPIALVIAICVSAWMRHW
jgi:hypothetical protein